MFKISSLVEPLIIASAVAMFAILLSAMPVGSESLSLDAYTEVSLHDPGIQDHSDHMATVRELCLKSYELLGYTHSPGSCEPTALNWQSAEQRWIIGKQSRSG